MIRFGTGGWRAVIADEFTKANIRIFAKAMADKMHAEGIAEEGILIGYDRRFLSKETMRWMAEVFAYENIPVSLINKSCPTPVTMFMVQKQNLHYGLMVTASHNPAIYNGIKVFTSGGRDADVNTSKDIEAYIARVQEPVQAADYEECVKAGTIREIYPINEYIDAILEDIDTDAIRRANLHVVLDPMYGVSETSIKTILITARCEIDTIHGGHDPLFGGHMPAPDDGMMTDLKAAVKTRNCDLGIATDGDADRIGVVDDTGRYLTPNDLLVILYYYLVRYRGMKGPAVRNLCTTHLLDRVAEKYGEQCHEVPVGFKWVSSKMDETGAIIGGESSGGLSVAGHIKGKDGIYAAALLVEMLAVTGRKMSEIYDDIRREFGESCFLENNLRFKPELKEEFRRRLIEDRELPDLPYETDHVSYMDGCKVYFKNGGWISVRFSGTEPLLRIFAEMPDREKAEDVIARFRSFLGL